MENSTILVAARFTVNEDRREQFERAIAEFTARAEHEPGTLTFRFFRGAAPGRYSAIEEYKDPDAALAHQTANQDLLQVVDDCASEVFMDLHGPVGPSIREWAQRARNVSLYEDSIPSSDEHQPS